MIKIENEETGCWEAAIRGMRNSYNSWGQSDSQFTPDGYIIGDNDKKLMKQLVLAGRDHSKFMRMIIVTLDITAPLYWWKEFDTYKIGTVRNSCSTMHTIMNKNFEKGDFSFEHLKLDIAYRNELIKTLNEARAVYKDFDNLKAKGYLYDNITDKKDIWWHIIQILPSSYNQRSTVMLNYQVLREMYFARRNHKLDEWHQFCEWIETLPDSDLITEVRK